MMSYDYEENPYPSLYEQQDAQIAGIVAQTNRGVRSPYELPTDLEVSESGESMISVTEAPTTFIDSIRAELSKGLAVSPSSNEFSEIYNTRHANLLENVDVDVPISNRPSYSSDFSAASSIYCVDANDINLRYVLGPTSTPSIAEDSDLAWDMQTIGKYPLSPSRFAYAELFSGAFDDDYSLCANVVEYEDLDLQQPLRDYSVNSLYELSCIPDLFVDERTTQNTNTAKMKYFFE